MASKLEELKKRADQAGKTYMVFKDRQPDADMFTENQRRTRKAAFLGVHLPLFEEYIEEAEDRLRTPEERRRRSWGMDDEEGRQLLRPLGKKEMLGKETGLPLAWDIGHQFPQSRVGSSDVIWNPDLTLAQKPSSLNPLDQDRMKPGRQRGTLPAGQGEPAPFQEQVREALANSPASIPDLAPRRIPDLGRGGAPGSELDMGLNDRQKKGLCEIAAWMYGKAGKDNMHLVEGIVERSAREKLLMYYVIENGKFQEISLNDVLTSQKNYVPDVTRFKKGITTSILGRMQWDRLSDASTIAYSMRGELSDIVSIERVSAHAKNLPAARPDRRRGGQGREAARGRGAGRRDQAEQGIEARFGSVIRAVNDVLGQNTPQTRKNLLDEVRELERQLSFGGPPGAAVDTGMAPDESGWSTAERHTTRTQRVWGWLKDPCKIVATFLGEGIPDAYSAVDNGVSFVGLLLSFASLVISCRDFKKTWDAATVGIRAAKFVTIAKDTVAALSGSLGFVSTIGKLQSVGWLWASHAGVAIASGAAQGLAGAAVFGLGGFKWADAGYRKALAEDISERGEQVFDQEENDAHMTPAQREALEKRRQLVRNVAAANKNRQKREEVTGVMQMVQGGLMVLSGIFTITGAGSIAGGVTSAVAFALGIANTITNWVMRQGEWTDVIDRCIDMDTLYREYRRRGVTIGRKEKQIKAMLRKEAEGVLGFSSDKKFFNYIMRRYATGLYQGAFLADDGHLPTSQEKAAEPDHKKEERQVFLDLLKLYKLKVVIPANGGEPAPNVDAIYKKLIS